MNIYIFEIKKYLKSTIIWILIIFLLGLLMISFYPIIKTDLIEFSSLINNYPKPIKNAFGINIDMMSTALGYFSSFPLTFIIICSTLQSIILGISIFNNEFKEKVSDFLLTKPVERKTIVTAKFLAYFTLIIITNLILFFSMYILIIIFNKGSININIYFMILFSVLLLQLIFLAVGCLIPTFLKKLKSSLSLSIGIIMGLYTLSTFVDDEKLLYFIPFKYFNYKYILREQKYETKYIILSLLVIIVSVIFTYKIYNKKDIY
ncbi:MAG: ABC transporter permease [Bacilli bacterium]|nr:ABC transporter permease [Bacilli bacterium]